MILHFIREIIYFIITFNVAVFQLEEKLNDPDRWKKDQISGIFIGLHLALCLSELKSLALGSIT